MVVHAWGAGMYGSDLPGGALVATALCCGLNPKDVMEEVLKPPGQHDWAAFKELRLGASRKILGLLILENSHLSYHHADMHRYVVTNHGV